MPLETGNYISDLVSTNPAGTDQRRQGDDHIRLVKAVLQSTFPNLDGAVTATPEEINQVSDTTRFFPSGGIIMWAGLIANIPTGWAVCDGTGIAGGIAIPDLRNRFILGADADVGGTDDVGDTGGSRNAINVSHNHTLTDHGHSHTLSSAGIYSTENTPPNTTVEYLSGSAIGPAYGGSAAFSNRGYINGGSANISIATAGSSGTNQNLPPYYALAYIIKL